MNFSLYIAKRYLLSKKSQNVINIISGISIVGVCVGTMALIIVLSVFNGFESLVISLYNAFDSDIKITASQGKSFQLTDLPAEEIKRIPGVVFYTDVIEENILLKYRDQQFIATIKGVNKEFLVHTGLDSMLVAGSLSLNQDGRPMALIGQGVAYSLGVNIDDFFSPLSVYVPKRGKTVNMANPEEAFSFRSIYPSGIFSIQQEIDTRYIIVPLEFAKELIDFDTEVNAIELDFAAGADKEALQKQIKDLAGEKFEVKNRYQQHEFLYKIMKSEKWVIFLILAFILVIATFNVIGSLTMLIIDKKKDIAILLSLGAEKALIKRIFLVEGVLIALVGAVSGITLGALVCWAQQQFGIISLQGSGSFVIESYPVKMQIEDFVYVFFTVMFIGFIAAWFPAQQIVKKQFKHTTQEL